MMKNYMSMPELLTAMNEGKPYWYGLNNRYGLTFHDGLWAILDGLTLDANGWPIVIKTASTLAEILED